MKNRIIILFLLAFSIGQCQTDTITPCQRFGKYLYDSLWADDFSQYCQGSCDIRGAVWETTVSRPAIVLRECHTDTSIQISGIAAPIYFDTTFNYIDSIMLPEYYYVFIQTDTGMTEIASARWDNIASHKVMQFYGIPPFGFPGSGGQGNDFPYGDRVATYPVYEARFSKPITVNGTFYVGGSTNNNYKVDALTFAHPGTRYMRWSFKYQHLSTECLNSIPRPDGDLIMYTGSPVDETHDTAFHSNMLLWPGFGCIFPIFYSPEDSTTSHNDTCFGTRGLRLLDISERNATVTWDDNSPSGGWELSIVKGDTATAVPENGVINSYGSNIASFYYLDSSWYTVFLRSVCNDELRSLWSDTIRFLIPQPATSTISTAESSSSISPNPTVGIIDISSSSIVNAITVLTPEGKTILDREYNSQSVKIDIGQYPAGTYIVIIKTSEGTFTRKVVKR